MCVTLLIWGWHQRMDGAEALRRFDSADMIGTSFALSSFCMSLMLSFRLTQTYYRWRDARAALTGHAQGTLSVYMQAATWIADPTLVAAFRTWCLVWQHSIKMFVENRTDLEPRIAGLLGEAELRLFDDAKVKRQICVTKIRQLAHDSRLSTEQFIAMDSVIQQTWVRASDAVRINYQAMPQGVSLMCTGFVFTWLVLLPFGLINGSDGATSNVSILPIMAIVSMLLLGVDETATQMEKPYRMLPLDDIYNSEERNMNNLLGELTALRNLDRR